MLMNILPVWYQPWRMPVTTLLRRILSFEMTIAEWIGTAIILGAPYLVIGVIWSATHTQHLSGHHTIDVVVSFLESIVSWPVLLFSDVCMA